MRVSTLAIISTAQTKSKLRYDLYLQGLSHHQKSAMAMYRRRDRTLNGRRQPIDSKHICLFGIKLYYTSRKEERKTTGHSRIEKIGSLINLSSSSRSPLNGVSVSWRNETLYKSNNMIAHFLYLFLCRRMLFAFSFRCGVNLAVRCKFGFQLFTSWFPFGSHSVSFRAHVGSIWFSCN